MAKKRVLLIVDDEKVIADGLKMMLKSEEYECIVAYSGEDGLKKAKEQTLDLVLLDIKMPEQDGFQVLQTLKQDASTSQVPVIMVTSCDTPEDIEKANKLGATDYFIKPINFNNLRDRIAKTLGTKP